MIHGILQFTLSIAFRYILHRGESRDIRCRESCLIGAVSPTRAWRAARTAIYQILGAIRTDALSVMTRTSTRRPPATRGDAPWGKIGERVSPPRSVERPETEQMRTEPVDGRPARRRTQVHPSKGAK